MEQVGRNPESDVKEALRKTKEELDRNAKDITDAINEIQISKFREELEKAEDEYLDVVGSAMSVIFLFCTTLKSNGSSIATRVILQIRKFHGV